MSQTLAQLIKGVSLASAPAGALTVDSSGRLLVGTSSAFSSTRNAYESEATPTREKYVATATNSVNNGFGVYNFSSSGYAPNLDLCASKNNTVGGHSVVSSDQAFGHINFGGSDGTQFRTGATILGAADGAPGSGDMPGKLVFSTTADGTSSPTERMRISNLGRIGVNAADPGTSRIYVNAAASDGNAIYAQKIGSTTAANVISAINGPAAGASGTHYGANGTYVAAIGVPGGGVIGILSGVFGILGYYDTSNSWAGYFNGSTYATGSYQGSDARLKDVIEPISGGILDKLAGIQPVKYRWKENTDQRDSVGDGIQIGLIAQEVEEHFPELVKEITHTCPINPEQLEEGQFDSSCSLNHELGTFKTLEYQHLAAVLVEALKEAKERIENLESKVAALEAQ
jgi:hypothetical protein